MPQRKRRHFTPEQKADAGHMARSTASFHMPRVAFYGKPVVLLARAFEAYRPPFERVVIVVLTRTHQRLTRVAYRFSADLRLTSSELVDGFPQRRSIEQFLSVAKVQMDLDSAGVREERADVSIAALCMALITWTAVWAYKRRLLMWARSLTPTLAERDHTRITIVLEAGPRTGGAPRMPTGMGSRLTSTTHAACTPAKGWLGIHESPT